MARILVVINDDFAALNGLSVIVDRLDGVKDSYFDILLLSSPSQTEELRTKRRKEVSAIIDESPLNIRIKPLMVNKASDVVDVTSFYDMILFDYNAAFSFIDDKGDTANLLYILKGSRCPVMILPEDYSELKHLIFTYDGKDTSVFAIKMFTLLFGDQCKDTEITILSVVQEDEDELFYYERHLMDFVRSKYKNVGLKHVYGEEASSEIYKVAQIMTDSLIVMGAYDRQLESYKERPSAARQIILKQNTPLFIAHH
ncbi:hypothetical protein [Persicobacter psychrovividus]|uniref:Universal stress protein family protein n=1 Tax=Persicobacter psychrovividus TaxID=387638 RepID=A0ABM7VC93_9BACT|nr:hypothetical protein PEPS_06320 [Persicobacter psychrovividus]